MSEPALVDAVDAFSEAALSSSGAFVSVTDAPFSADVSGATDATAAIQAAIDAYPNGNVTIYIPGTPLVSGAINVSKDYTVLVQLGKIRFAPTGAADALGTYPLFNFSAGASILYGCGLYNAHAYSTDTVKRKVLCRITDCSEFTLFNPRSGNDGQWTGANSVGLWTRGRDTSVFYAPHFRADTCIYIDKNPNAANLEDADHFTFYDCFLVPSDATKYGIECADGVHWSNTNFHNGNVSKGVGIIHWNNTTGAGVASHDLVFSGTWRHEQATDITKPMVHLSATVGLLQSLVLDGIYGGAASNGIYVRQNGVGASLTVRDYHFVQAGGVALDFDGAELVAERVICQVGSSVSMANMTQTKGELPPAGAEPISHDTKWLPSSNATLAAGIMDVFGGVRRFPARGSLANGASLVLAPFQGSSVVGSIRVGATGASKSAHISASVDGLGAFGSVAGIGEIAVAPGTPTGGKFTLFWQGAAAVSLANNSGETMSYVVLVDWI
jgi:hypothetical protein